MTLGMSRTAAIMPVPKKKSKDSTWGCTTCAKFFSTSEFAGGMAVEEKDGQNRAFSFV
jgi:hypothetical protein